MGIFGKKTSLLSELALEGYKDFVWIFKTVYEEVALGDCLGTTIIQRRCVEI